MNVNAISSERNFLSFFIDFKFNLMRIISNELNIAIQYCCSLTLLSFDRVVYRLNARVHKFIIFGTLTKEDAVSSLQIS